MSAKPYLFDFTTTLERSNGSEELETEVRVTCRVQRLSAAAGFANEPSNGRRVVEITNTEHDGLPLSDLEIAELHERALDELCYH